MAPHPGRGHRVVYLVRHGQSEWNVARLTQGQTAHPRLTGTGREEARGAAARIASDATDHGVAVRRIVTSDLVRAVETADILATELGVARVCDPRLREQGLGHLEGTSYDETWSALDRHDWSDPSAPVAGGESVLEVRHRMSEALAALDGAAPTVVVSHGDAIRAAVAVLTGVAAHEAPWLEVPNGAVARVTDRVTWLR